MSSDIYLHDNRERIQSAHLIIAPPQATNKQTNKHKTKSALQLYTMSQNDVYTNIFYHKSFTLFGIFAFSKYELKGEVCFPLITSLKGRK